MRTDDTLLADDAAGRPLADIGLCDFDAFQRGEHHEMFTTLRNTGSGVHWTNEPGGTGFWSITRLEHLREINRHPDVFSSNAGGTQIHDAPPDDLEAQLRRDAIMLDMDPPKHTRYRKLVNRGFTPRMIGLLESYLENRTRIIVDKVCEKGECDFVVELASELPLQAIAEMMGVPVEDRSRIFDWTNRMIGANDPEFGNGPETSQQAMAELYAYANELRRQHAPADDIVTTLLHAELDGDSLSEWEFDMFFLLLCVAGNETTRNTISHGMHAFMTHPGQWERFRADPEAHMDTAMEEVLRWATPVMHFRRTATRDHQIGDVEIKAGDKVVMWHISANRDERAFDDPFTFDVGRAPNDHVAFGGGGPHFCLGANLARMEMRLMFREIAGRLGDMQLAGEPQYLRSNFIGGIKHMPVSFTPSTSTLTQPMDRLGAAASDDTLGYGRQRGA
jgi:cholest-4-en-3-one 26-monooxygenase